MVLEVELEVCREVVKFQLYPSWSFTVSVDMFKISSEVWVNCIYSTCVCLKVHGCFTCSW